MLGKQKQRVGCKAVAVLLVCSFLVTNSAVAFPQNKSFSKEIVTQTLAAPSGVADMTLLPDQLFLRASWIIGHFLYADWPESLKRHIVSAAIKDSFLPEELEICNNPEDLACERCRLHQIKYNDDEKAYYLPVFQGDTIGCYYKFYIDGDEASAFRVIPMADGRMIYVSKIDASNIANSKLLIANGEEEDGSDGPDEETVRTSLSRVEKAGEPLFWINVHGFVVDEAKKTKRENAIKEKLSKKGVLSSTINIKESTVSEEIRGFVRHMLSEDNIGARRIVFSGHYLEANYGAGCIEEAIKGVVDAWGSHGWELILPLDLIDNSTKEKLELSDILYVLDFSGLNFKNCRVFLNNKELIESWSRGRQTDGDPVYVRIYTSGYDMLHNMGVIRSAPAFEGFNGIELADAIEDILDHRVPRLHSYSLYEAVLKSALDILYHQRYYRYLNEEGRKAAKEIEEFYRMKMRGPPEWSVEDFARLKELAALIPTVKNPQVDLFVDVFPDCDWMSKFNNIRPIVTSGCSNQCLFCAYSALCKHLEHMPFPLAAKIILKTRPKHLIPYRDSEPFDYVDSVIGADIADIVAYAVDNDIEDASLVFHGLGMGNKKSELSGNISRRLVAPHAISFHIFHKPVFKYAVRKVSSRDRIDKEKDDQRRERIKKQYVRKYVHIVKGAIDSEQNFALWYYVVQKEIYDMLKGYRDAYEVLKEIESLQSGVWDEVRRIIFEERGFDISKKSCIKRNYEADPIVIFWSGKAAKLLNRLGVPKRKISAILKKQAEINKDEDVSIQREKYTVAAESDGTIALYTRESTDDGKFRAVSEMFKDHRSYAFGALLNYLDLMLRIDPDSVTRDDMDVSCHMPYKEGASVGFKEMIVKALTDEYGIDILYSLFYGDFPKGLNEEDITKRILLILEDFRFRATDFKYFNMLRNCYFDGELVKGLLDNLNDENKKKLYELLRDVPFPVQISYSFPILKLDNTMGWAGDFYRFVREGDPILKSDVFTHSRRFVIPNVKAFEPFSKQKIRRKFKLIFGDRVDSMLAARESLQKENSPAIYKGSTLPDAISYIEAFEDPYEEDSSIYMSVLASGVRILAHPKYYKYLNEDGRKAKKEIEEFYRMKQRGPPEWSVEDFARLKELAALIPTVKNPQVDLFVEVLEGVDPEDYSAIQVQLSKGCTNQCSTCGYPGSCAKMQHMPFPVAVKLLKKLKLKYLKPYLDSEPLDYRDAVIGADFADVVDAAKELDVKSIDVVTHGSGHGGRLSRKSEETARRLNDSRAISFHVYHKAVLEYAKAKVSGMASKKKLANRRKRLVKRYVKKLVPLIRGSIDSRQEFNIRIFENRPDVMGIVKELSQAHDVLSEIESIQDEVWDRTKRIILDERSIDLEEKVEEYRGGEFFIYWIGRAASLLHDLGVPEEKIALIIDKYQQLTRLSARQDVDKYTLHAIAGGDIEMVVREFSLKYKIRPVREIFSGPESDEFRRFLEILRIVLNTKINREGITSAITWGEAAGYIDDRAIKDDLVAECINSENKFIRDLLDTEDEDLMKEHLSKNIMKIRFYDSDLRYLQMLGRLFIDKEKAMPLINNLNKNNLARLFSLLSEVPVPSAVEYVLDIDFGIYYEHIGGVLRFSSDDNPVLKSNVFDPYGRYIAPKVKAFEPFVSPAKNLEQEFKERFPDNYKLMLAMFGDLVMKDPAIKKFFDRLMSLHKGPIPRERLQYYVSLLVIEESGITFEPDYRMRFDTEDEAGNMTFGAIPYDHLEEDFLRWAISKSIGLKDLSFAYSLYLRKKKEVAAVHGKSTRVKIRAGKKHGEELFREFTEKKPVSYKVKQPMYKDDVISSGKIRLLEPLYEEDLVNLCDSYGIPPENIKMKVHEEEDRYDVVLMTGDREFLNRAGQLLGKDLGNWAALGYAQIKIRDGIPIVYAFQSRFGLPQESSNQSREFVENAMVVFAHMIEERMDEILNTDMPIEHIRFVTPAFYLTNPRLAVTTATHYYSDIPERLGYSIITMEDPIEFGQFWKTSFLYEKHLKGDVSQDDPTRLASVASFRYNFERTQSCQERKLSFIALGTSWIKGYNRGPGGQFNDLNPLISEIRTFCERNGVEFILGDDVEVARRVREIKDDPENSSRRGLVIAGNNITEVLSLEDYENLFLTGVDNEQLKDDSYIHIMEILALSLYVFRTQDTNIAKLAANHPELGIQIIRENYLLLLPTAGPVDYDKLKKPIYAAQVAA